MVVVKGREGMLCPCIVSLEKKRNINSDLAILLSHDNMTLSGVPQTSTSQASWILSQDIQLHSALIMDDKSCSATSQGKSTAREVWRTASISSNSSSSSPIFYFPFPFPFLFILFFLSYLSRYNVSTTACLHTPGNISMI